MNPKKTVLYLAVVIAIFVAAATVHCQQPQQPDPNAPPISLEEKISLTTDDVKMSDALEIAKKAYQETVKPIADHQLATKAVIEKEHPGWTLERGPDGWHLAKKPEPAKTEPKPESPKATPPVKK